MQPGDEVIAGTGQPYWYSGAGKRRAAPDIWTNPAKIAQKNAIIAAASRFKVDPQVYYNALSEAGVDPGTLTANQIIHPNTIPAFSAGAGVAGGRNLGQMVGGDRSNPFSGIPLFLKNYQEIEHLPAIRDKYGPYEQMPGALKLVTDVATGHLMEQMRKPPSERVYKGERLAPLTEAQKLGQAFQTNIAGQAAANAPIHQSVLSRLSQLQSMDPLLQAGTYLDQGVEPVTEAERGQFRQSAMDNIVAPLREKMRRDLLENIIPAIDANRLQRGNLYGGGRDRLREKALTNFEREFAEASLPHLFAAEQSGQKAGEAQRQALIHAGQIHAPASVQAMGAMRESAQATQGALHNRQMQDLIAAEAANTAGMAQQAQKQREMDIEAENWLAENNGLLDIAGQVGNIVRGHQLPTSRLGAERVPAPSTMSTLGQMAMGLGAMNAMNPSYPGAQPRKTGGRVKLATGGPAIGNFYDKITNFSQGLSGNGVLNSILGGSNDQSLASQQVQQDMLNQPAPPPEPAQPVGGALGALPMPEPGPLERGGDRAMSALEKMNQYRSQLDQRANDLDSGAHDTNPILPFLARTLMGAAGSKNIDLGQRLGEGAQGGYQAFEQQRAVNARNKELSENIKKGLMETYQKEHEHELKLQAQKDIAAFKASAPAKPKFYYNQQTGTHYTVDENGQMVVAPGAPAPQTPQMKSEEELSKVRQVEAVKTEEENVKKLQEDVNKAQRSIGNYNTIIGLMKDTGVNKYIGPLKSKFFQNDKVQGLLLNKKAVSEIRTFNSSLNKAVLDDIKLTGANPSDRDVAIVENSKPSNSDTPEAAFKKALINKAAYERTRDFANFTKKMWREKGWPSYKSQEVYNRWMQANPLFNADGSEILKPKDRPEAYENVSEESGHDIIGKPEEGPDEVVTPYAPKSAAPIGMKQIMRDQDQIRAALMAKRAGAK